MPCWGSCLALTAEVEAVVVNLVIGCRHCLSRKT